MAQMVKNLPAMWDTWILSLGEEDPLEEGMTTHSNILPSRIPMDRGASWATVRGAERVGHNREIKAHHFLPITVKQLTWKQWHRTTNIYYSFAESEIQAWLMGAFDSESLLKLLSKCWQGMLSSQSLVAVALLLGSLTHVQVQFPCWLLAGFISCFLCRSVSRTTGNVAVCYPENKDLRKRGKRRGRKTGRKKDWEIERDRGKDRGDPQPKSKSL